MKLRIVAIVGVLLYVAACGGDSSALSGRATETYDVSYDKIMIERQLKNGETQAVFISYVRDPGGPNEQSPVIVVVNAPIDVGEEIDFRPTKGDLRRAVGDGSDFPELDVANIRFDSLGEVGGTASGRFNTTFVDGETLNGDFSGTVGERSAN